MKNGDKFIVLLIIIAFIIVFFGFKNQKTHTNPKNEPVPIEPIKDVPTENPYPQTCFDSNGVVTDCEKGA